MIGALLVASLLAQPTNQYVKKTGDFMTGPLDSKVASGGRAYSLLAGAKFCLDGTTCAIYVTGTGWVGVFTINGSLVVTSTVAGTNAIAATAAGNGNGVVGNSVGTNSGVQGNNTTTTTGNGVGGTCSGVGSSCNAVNGLQNDSTGTGAAVRAKQNGVGPGVQVDASAGTGYGINFVSDTTSPARGSIHFQCMDSNPSTSANGDFYCNSAASNIPRWYNGSWRDFNISGSANSGLSYTSTATSGNQSFIQALGARHCLDGATCSVYLSGVDSTVDYGQHTGSFKVENSGTSSYTLWLKNTSTNGFTNLVWMNSADSVRFSLGVGNPTTAAPYTDSTYMSLNAGPLKVLSGSTVIWQWDDPGVAIGITSNYPVKYDSTDSTGTPGNATINKPAGRTAIAAAGTAATVTNSMVVAASNIQVTQLGNDATCTDLYVSAVAAGSFTVACKGAAATAAQSFMWSVH